MARWKLTMDKSSFKSEDFRSLATAIITMALPTSTVIGNDVHTTYYNAGRKSVSDDVVKLLISLNSDETMKLLGKIYLPQTKLPNGNQPTID